MLYLIVVLFVTISPLTTIDLKTGDKYIEYDNKNDRAKIFNKHGQRYPRRISDDFPGIPYPIDTVFYKWDEGLLYFFKGEYVSEIVRLPFLFVKN